MFPNFNMPIVDPQLLSTLKFQIQIVGAVPTGITYGATLHYQMVYRIQNHSLDFVTPQSTEDALFLQVETDHPSCIYVPRQISRNELLKLIPNTWLTSYEQHHQNSKNTQPIQSTTHHFQRNSKGQDEIMFKREPTQKKPPCFPTQYAFTKAEENVLIYAFDSEEKPIYVQSKDGHMY
ncbi:hypothetical protein Adt_26799 [Abeliophyllum distichum]|uniref:Uncharacterized protein n=1 Tax=Abeliophyllum distichum TaxID=126358 RepID=A0ABD1RS64_9LAMI